MLSNFLVGADFAMYRKSIFSFVLLIEILKKTPSKVGYFRKIGEIFHSSPSCPKTPKIIMHVGNLGEDTSV